MTKRANPRLRYAPVRLSLNTREQLDLAGVILADTVQLLDELRAAKGEDRSRLANKVRAIELACEDFVGTYIRKPSGTA